MRGSDAQQSAMFSYVSPEQRVPSGHPLRKVREMTDRLLGELSDLFDQMYSTMGRPSIAPERLLRALLLQVLYTVRSVPMVLETLIDLGQSDVRTEIRNAEMALSEVAEIVALAG